MGGESKPAVPNISRDTSRSSWLLRKALPHLFRQASSEWINDNAPRLGASVAFYTLLSLSPVIVIAVAVAAAVYGQEAAQGRLSAEIQGIAGPDVAHTIQEIIARSYQPRTGLIATFLGLATLVFGASSVFVELHDAMNTIWGVPLPLDRNHAATIIRLIRDRFYSFVTVLGIGFLLVVSLMLNAWIAAMRISVPRVATFTILYLVIAVLFAALYKIVPNVKVKWSDVTLGAMITSLLFMIGKQLMGLYFAHTSLGSTYSAAGSPIVGCYGSITRRSYSFGALSSVRCTRRLWGPNATGSIESAGAGAAGNTGTGGLPHPYFPNCRTTYHARGSPSTRLESTSC